MPASNWSRNKAASRWHRWLDRHLGITAIAVSSLFRAKRELPTDIRRIALIKGDGMGDLVLLTGPVRDLCNAFLHARISFWGGSSAAPLARALTLFDEVHDLNFKEPLSAIHALRAWHADVVIDAGQWSAAEAFISAMSGARFVISFQTANQHRHRLCDAAVEHRSDRHELENFRALLAPLGVTERSEPFIDKIDNPESQRSLAAPYIVFHMWPSGVTHTHLKRWPENYWASLAEACIERGRRVVLTGGRQDVGPTRQWMARFDSENKIDDRAGISIRETIFILQNAEGVVSVNTGVMHLAAALGVPTVGLHGPTNAKRWGPIGERAMSLQVPSPHGAYLSLGFEYPADADARDGMERIGVRDVLLALAKFIPDFQIRVPSKAAELVEA